MPILPIDAGRYGSDEIKRIFDEEERLKYMLEFEATVAEARGELGIIPPASAREIAQKARSGRITVRRVRELEAVSEHDIAAVVEALSELCSEQAKPWVHYGLTSYDVVDTSISMQMNDALPILEKKIAEIASILAEKALQYKGQPAAGRTHGQHASIISFGLKFAVWASDMLAHLSRLKQMKPRVLVCKTLGVVGTGSLMGEMALQVQELVAKKLNLYPLEAATQVVSREKLAELICSLALVASTLDKMAVEIRNLQRTEIGEVMEPFREKQMGSSAVPVKRNPIKSERVSSLARMLRSMVSVSLENVALWHERDLTNSANERFVIPMAVILLDEMLSSIAYVITGLKVDVKRIEENLNLTKGQIFAEFVLGALVKKGVPRLEAYRAVQRVAFEAAQSNSHFLDALSSDSEVSSRLSRQELEIVFDARSHLASSARIIDGVAGKVREVCGMDSTGD